MAVTSGVILIDLGLDRGEPPTYAAPARSTVPSWFPVAVLAVLVLLLAGASSAPARPPLNALFTLHIGPADNYALTGDGHLLAQTFGLLTSYDLDTGRMRWQAGQSAPSYRLRLGDDLVLMRPWTTGSGDPGTAAISVHTGAAQWERPGNVVTVAGAATLLAVTSVRSAGGSGRRVQGSVDAVDPGTGQTRWTIPVPNTAVLAGVPGHGDADGRILLVHDDRTLALHDLGDGRLLARHRVPAADYHPGNPVVAGGMILLRHPGHWGSEITAYDPVTLERAWTVPAAGAYEIESCGSLACLSGPHRVRAIDPDTGVTRWVHQGWRSIQAFGPAFVAYGAPDDTDPLTTFDPDTGAAAAGLRGWRPVPGVDLGDRLVLTREDSAGARTMVAVARPGDQRLHPLAALPAGTGDCQAVPGRLVCRSRYGELVVWAYREG